MKFHFSHTSDLMHLGAGQFEHTLIIVEDDAYLHFIEGCSAPKYNVANLHAGCVELYVGKNAYSQILNN